MRKSIKRAVILRAVVALSSMLMCIAVVNISIVRLKDADSNSQAANALLERAQAAEIAHYQWCSNLSNALYAGKEFSGSSDPKSCELGQWLYGEPDVDDEEILRLRQELEPLHKELHNSVTQVIDVLKQNPAAAQAYYQNTIQMNVGKLVELLKQVVSNSERLRQQSIIRVEQTVQQMQILSGIFFLLSLISLVCLVRFVIREVVWPILHITERSSGLMEGKLDMQIEYTGENELGELAQCIHQSMQQINAYVLDLNHVMEQLSEGKFDVQASVQYIGDFSSIQQSIDLLTVRLSNVMRKIDEATHQVSGNAGQMANSAQTLAQGAVQQTNAVEHLLTSLKSLSENAKRNTEIAVAAQQHAQAAGAQITKGDHDMENMVIAMSDISEAARKIENIITTIESIAFQTNILALNAAVEAARAGSAGKGFAVVADEVRSLAGQSDQAAKATKELIENTIQAVERGNTIVEQMSSMLKQTLNLAAKSGDEIGVIAKAVQGEAEEIIQLADDVNQISAVVHTNSATSEEAAAVSQEMFAQVQMLEEQTHKFSFKK